MSWTHGHIPQAIGQAQVRRLLDNMARVRRTTIYVFMLHCWFINVDLGPQCGYIRATFATISIIIRIQKITSTNIMALALTLVFNRR
jgi:hypothetical protein